MGARRPGALGVGVARGVLRPAGLRHEAPRRLAAVRGGEGPQGAVGRAAARLEAELGARRVRSGLTPFVERYPAAAAYRGEATPTAELADGGGRAAVLEGLVPPRLGAGDPAPPPGPPRFP